MITVCKSLGRRRAVDVVTFALQTGETFDLLGPNGVGKSTIIHVLLGVTARDSPQSGA